MFINGQVILTQTPSSDAYVPDVSGFYTLYVDQNNTLNLKDSNNTIYNLASSSFVNSASANALIQSTTISDAMSANSYIQSIGYTNQASANLQQQISQIIQEGTTITSSAGSINVSKNGLTYNVEVSNAYSSNYTTLATSNTISGQLYSLVTDTSAGLVSLTYSASANSLSQAQTVTFAASANSLSQAQTVTFAASANALTQSQTVTFAASANSYNQAYSVIASTSAAIVNYDIAQDAAMSGALVSLSFAVSANALAQAQTVTFAASANALAQSQTITFAASANSYNQSVGYTTIVSGNLVQYINNSTASLAAVAAASANALAQSQTVTFAASANALAQSQTITFAASANALAQSQTITFAASANSFIQSKVVTFAASANALAQSQTITFAASANALAQANLTSYVTLNTQQTISGAKTFTSEISATGDMVIGDNIYGMIRSQKSLILQEDGDQYGTTRLTLMNRNGFNGPKFETLNTTVALIDFVFAYGTALSGARNIRLEGRSGSTVLGVPTWGIGGSNPATPTLAIDDNGVATKGNSYLSVGYYGYGGALLTSTSTSAGQTVLKAKGAPGQTAPLQVWTNNTDTILSNVNTIGEFTVPNIYDTGLGSLSGNFITWDKNYKLVDTGLNISTINSLTGSLQTQINSTNANIAYLASVTGGFATSSLIASTSAINTALTYAASANALAQANSNTTTQLTSYTTLAATKSLTGALQTQIDATNSNISYLASVTGGFATSSLIASTSAINASLTYDASANALAQANGIINSITGNYVDLSTDQTINGNKKFNNYVIANVISAGNSRLLVSRDNAQDPGSFGAVTQPSIILMSDFNNSTGLVFQNKNGGNGAESRFAVVENGAGNNGNGSYITVSMPGTGNSSTMFGYGRDELATIFVNSAGTPRKLAIGTYTNQDVIIGANNTEMLKLDSSQQDFIVKATSPTSAAANTIVMGGGSLIAKNNITGSNIIVSSLGSVNGNFLTSDINNRIVDSGFNTSTINSLTGSLQTQINSANSNISYLASVTGGFATSSLIASTSAINTALTYAASANALAQANGNTTTQLASYTTLAATKSLTGSLQTQINSTNANIAYLASVTGSFATNSLVASTSAIIISNTFDASANAYTQAVNYIQPQIDATNANIAYLATVTGGFATSSLIASTSAINTALTYAASANALTQANAYSLINPDLVHISGSEIIVGGKTFTNVVSAAGYYSSILGGTISNLFDLQKSPTGFPNRTDSTMAFDSSNRLFSISGSYDVYGKGVRYHKTGENQIISNTIGQHFFYYNINGVFTYSVNTPWSILAGDIMIAMVYWDGTKGILVEERHGMTMDQFTHYYLHMVNGTERLPGFGLSGPVVQGNNDATNTYAIASGILADEDIIYTTSSLASGGPYNLAYRTGVNGDWTWTTGSSVPYFNASNNIQWNENTGSTWQLTQTTVNNRYVNYYVIASTAISANQSFFVVAGQTLYTSLANAQAESWDSLSLGSTFPFVEFNAVYQITYRYNTAYATTGRARTEATPVLLSITKVNAAAAGTHNTLGGLQGGSAGEYYHLTAAQFADIIGRTEVTSISAGLLSTTFAASANSYTQAINALTTGTVNLSGKYVDLVTSQSVGGIKAFTNTISAPKFLLGSDLSLIPASSNQSTISTWWGLQLKGNQQSDVSIAPATIGSPGSYDVLIPSSRTGSVTLAIFGSAGQTQGATVWYNNTTNKTPVAGVFNDGSISGSSLLLTGLNTAQAGNFLTWNSGQKLVDSGMSSQTVINVSGAFNKDLAYDVLTGALTSVTTIKGVKTMNYDSNGTLISISGSGIYQSKTFVYTNGNLTQVIVV